MSLLDRLDIAAADINPRRYNKVGCECELADITEIDKDTDKGPRTLVTLHWQTKAELTTTDGRKLAPGATLRQERWVDTSNQQSLDSLAKDLKYVSVAINGLKPTAEAVPNVSKADIGKTAFVWLTYTPSKEDPSDLSKGFQNFRVSPVKAS